MEAFVIFEGGNVEPKQYRHDIAETLHCESFNYEGIQEFEPGLIGPENSFRPAPIMFDNIEIRGMSVDCEGVFEGCAQKQKADTEIRLTVHKKAEKYKSSHLKGKPSKRNYFFLNGASRKVDISTEIYVIKNITNKWNGSELYNGGDPLVFVGDSSISNVVGFYDLISGEVEPEEVDFGKLLSFSPMKEKDVMRIARNVDIDFVSKHKYRPRKDDITFSYATISNLPEDDYVVELICRSIDHPGEVNHQKGEIEFRIDKKYSHFRSKEEVKYEDELKEDDMRDRIRMKMPKIYSQNDHLLQHVRMEA